MFRIIYSILRIIFILIQNLLQIPAYLFTTHVVLYPIYLYNSNVYWKLENFLYDCLLYTVSSWSYCAGIRVYECGEKWFSSDLDSTCVENNLNSRSEKKQDIENNDIESLSSDNEDFSAAKLINENDNTLIICNHQSTSDVPLMFVVFTNYLQKILLWVMDAQFKYTNFGVVSWSHGDFFIRPKEFKSGDLIEHCLKHSYKNCYILYPEGGFRYKKVESSNRYADKNNLTHLKYVTWPRYGAFKDLLDSKLKVSRIIDCSIIYPDIDKPLTIFDILKGNKKADVYVHYKTYFVEKEKIDENWLRDVWMKKENLIKSFYENKQNFLQDNQIFNLIKLSWLKIILINLFFTILTIIYILFFRYLFSYN